MTSRPQFSLRMLLLVMLLVCLAAATVAELPEEQKLANAIQNMLRVVLCILFPAMLLAGAVAKRGYERTMYIGGVFAAAVPLLTAFATLYVVIASQDLPTLWARLNGFLEVLWLLRRAFAVLWSLIPCAALACLLVHWLWQQGERATETEAFSAMQVALRVAVAGAAALFATSLAVRNIQAHLWLANAQHLLIVMFIVVVPALLVVGAVQGSSHFRTFCIGGVLPSAFPLLLTCRALSGNIARFDSPTDWSITLACLSPQRFLTTGICVCAPLFGLACACFHAMLPRCVGTAEGSDALQSGSNAGKRLLLAFTMVCLVVLATVEIPEERNVAAMAQDVIRMALSIAFPAALLAGVVVTRGYARTIYIGGLFAASGPLIAVLEPSFVMIANHWLQATPGPLDAFTRELPFLRRPFAVLWALVPCAALVCFLVHRLWRQGDEAGERTTLSVAQIAYRAALTGAAAIFATTVAIGIQSHGLLADFQRPLMLTLKVVFPALLVIGAVEGTGRFRIFCIGGALPAIFALTLVCMWLGRNAYIVDSAANWSTAVASLAQQRRSTAGLWACAPLLGSACVFFHWLFQRGEAKANAE